MSATAAVSLCPTATRSPFAAVSRSLPTTARRTAFPKPATTTVTVASLSYEGTRNPAGTRPRKPAPSQAFATFPEPVMPSRTARRSNPLDKDVERVLLTEAEIHSRVLEIADQISEDLVGRNDVVMLGVLTGAFMFTSDLVKNLSIPAEVKFMKASSYGKATESCGEVDISNAFVNSEDIEGKTVMIVEDIIDTGNTLLGLKDYIWSLNPRDVRIVCLLDKPLRRKAEVKVDYTAFSVPDEFVVGYGLDFAGNYRCLPYIGVLKPELYM